MRVARTVQHALNQPELFVSTTFKELEYFIFSTVPAENASKKQSVGRLWSIISNSAVNSIDKPDRGQVTAR